MIAATKTASMHRLWVEVEVEKELGFHTKKDIEAYGMDKFTRKCVERVQRFSGIITEQSKRLGQWMDWENSYFTHTDKNIGGIWHFLKTCHEHGWIEREYKPCHGARGAAPRSLSTK